MLEQVVIDSEEFARKGGALHGTIAVSELARLHGQLYSDEGVFEYSVTGGINSQGKPILRLQVKGQVNLVCQRCLGGLTHAVEATSELVLVRRTEDFVDLDEEDDAVDSILADKKMDVIALVEEEILLALPMIPLHEIAECSAGGKDSSPGLPKGESPFASLASLKKRGRT